MGTIEPIIVDTAEEAAKLLPPKHRAPVLRSDGLVEVALSNRDQPAIVERDVFERLVANRVSTQWHIKEAGQYSYVRVRSPAKGQQSVAVARLIMALDHNVAGLFVRHRNQDRYDLRRANLYLDHGNGWHDGLAARACARELVYRRAL